MKWYTIKAFSGKERQVADRILCEAEARKLSDYIEEVLVPTENVVEMREGKKRSRVKVFYPGYIMIKMELTKRRSTLLKMFLVSSVLSDPKGAPRP
jgi:transcriptional antiterminator NusG